MFIFIFAFIFMAKDFDVNNFLKEIALGLIFLTPPISVGFLFILKVISKIGRKKYTLLPSVVIIQNQTRCAVTYLSLPQRRFVSTTIVKNTKRVQVGQLSE